MLAYASDPAAPTAAFVAEKLGLAGSPYKSVEILCNKDLFRKFLFEHDFCTPKAKGYNDIDSALSDIKNGYFNLPVIVKPVDSSGSKGVSKIEEFNNIEHNLENAMAFSRGKRIIVEEFIEKYGYQIAGDGLSVDGELVFRYFAMIILIVDVKIRLYLYLQVFHTICQKKYNGKFIMRFKDY